MPKKIFYPFDPSDTEAPINMGSLLTNEHPLVKRWPAIRPEVYRKFQAEKPILIFIRCPYVMQKRGLGNIAVLVVWVEALPEDTSGLQEVMREVHEISGGMTVELAEVDD